MTIDTTLYRTAIAEIYTAAGLPDYQLLIVESVQEWARSVHIAESNPNRLAKAVRADGRPLIVLRRGPTTQTMALVIPTARLRLNLQSTEALLARIEAMSPTDRAEVSSEWLARMRKAEPSAWTHGFEIVDAMTGAVVGSCAYKAPPDSEGSVEIAYGIHPDQQGRGYAKESAAALVEFAFGAGARLVRAHTRPHNDASARVLVACGFERIGDIVDPEDGLVWRWELSPGPRPKQVP